MKVVLGVYNGDMQVLRSICDIDDDFVGFEHNPICPICGITRISLMPYKEDEGSDE